MKMIRLSLAAIAAVLSTFSVSVPALAQAAPVAAARGHDEWRSVPQFGSRTSGPSRVRMWVPALDQMASCNCAMMQASATDWLNGEVKARNG